MRDQHSVDIFISINKHKLPSDKFSELNNKLLNCSESEWNTIRFLELKEPNSMLLISLFVGYWGIERFMLGKKISGIMKFLIFQLSLIGEIACIFFFIADQYTWGTICLLFFLVGVTWWIIDLCLVRRMTKEYNYNQIVKLINL